MHSPISYFSLLFLFTLASSCSELTKKPQQNSAPEVDVSQPIQAVITQWDEYTGRFAAVNQAEIRARVSGYLQQTRFKDGLQSYLIHKFDYVSTFVLQPQSKFVIYFLS